MIYLVGKIIMHKEWSYLEKLVPLHSTVHNVIPFYAYRRERLIILVRNKRTGLIFVNIETSLALSSGIYLGIGEW